ncbi:MAG: hypothetical protein MN733_10740 [Nitrososphaera sp.]|nr:hypothetical protein [Nitrososphaera sp.]
MAPIIRATFILVPIALPVALAFFSSFYDDTFKRRGRLSAKLCFAGVTFDIWGLTTVLRDGPSPTSTVTAAELGVFLIFLMLMHIGFNYLCIRPFSGQRWAFFRVGMILVSVSIPVALLIPNSMF